jgi:hypothetical protein
MSATTEGYGALVVLSALSGSSQDFSSAVADHEAMTLTIAVINAVLVAALVAALVAVMRIPFRLERQRAARRSIFVPAAVGERELSRAA